MKTLTSTIFSNGEPLEDGIDLALAFAEANKNAISSFIQERDKKLKAITKEITELNGAKPQKNGITIGIIGAVMGLLLLLALWPLAIIIILSSAAVGYFMAKKAIKEQQGSIENKESEKKKILNENPPQVVTHIGKIGYAAKVVPFEDGKMIIDVSGILKKTELKYPEIPQGAERIKDLSGTMSQIPDELPVLLPSTGQTDLQEKPRLTGIESDIEEVLSISDTIFSDTVDVKTKLPVYEINDNIVHSLKHLHKFIKDGQQDVNLGLPDKDIDKSVTSLEKTSREANELKKMGAENIENLMTNVIHKMDSYVNNTKIARDNSLMNILNDGLNNLKTIYDYPLTRFYCPKCHQVENYIRSKMPVQDDDLNEVPVDKLNPFYRSSEMMHLRKLADSIKRYFEQARKNGDDLTLPAFNVLRGKLEKYESRIKELAVEIEGLDSKAEVHRKNAILKYNTIKRKWTCQLCGETFNDKEAQWARILKVKDDLIIPIWDNLWLEKHDERNRIIREKELELRTNMEKESTQLRETDKEFTEGYRLIRNKLDDSSSGYTVSKNKLDMMLNFFSSRGILSNETVKSMREYFGPGGQSGNINEIIDVAAQLQEQLRKEPETVFIRRAGLVDYADEVRNAGKYFNHEGDIDSSLVLEDEIDEFPLIKSKKIAYLTDSTESEIMLNNEEKYNITLLSIGKNKAFVIKIVSEIKNLNLSEARKIVESAPIIISENISKTEADEIIKKLSNAGAEAQISINENLNVKNADKNNVQLVNEDLFEIVLESAGLRKLQVIKIINEVKNIGLSEARKLVESAPITLFENMNKSKKDEMEKKLTDAGAQIKINKK